MDQRASSVCLSENRLMDYYNSFSMVEQEYDQEEEVLDHVVGFEKGRIWLPAHVLDHHEQEKPISSQLKQSSYRRPHDYNHHKQYYHHQHRRPKISLPGHHDSIIPRHNSFSKSSSATTTLYHHHRPRFPTSSTSRVSSAGPGMQAVFLDSGRKTSSCGTGFFLPQRAGSTTFQPNKKSTCSPVLLPSRVVQALNLNVHELGSPLTSRRDPNIQKLLDNNNNRNDRGDDQSSVNSTFMCSVASQTRSSSPELFLPKEWTY